MSQFQGFNQPNHELLLSIFAVTHFFILDANRVRDSVNASFSIIMASYVLLVIDRILSLYEITASPHSSFDLGVFLPLQT